MANVRKDLEKAYELINKERLDEALTILKPITFSDPDNADAWWLTANAASEPRDARRALVNVLKLNPKYPKARQLLDQLNEMYPPRDDELLMMLEIEDIEPEMPSGPLDAVSFDLDDDSGEIDNLFHMEEDEDDDFEPLTDKTPPRTKARANEVDPFVVDEDDFATVEEDDPFASLLSEDTPRQRSSSGSRRLIVALAALLLVGLLAVILFVFVLGGDDEGGDDTTTASNDPGDLVAADVASVENASVDELESVRLATEADAQMQIDPSATAVYVQTDNGLALMVRVCTAPGPQVFRMVREGFEVVSLRSSVPSLASQLTMVGVSVQDCTNQDVLYRAMATATDATAFSNSTTNYAAFQQTWTNVES